jgi:hypothetical protein
MLAPMPIAMTLGLGGPAAPFTISEFQKREGGAAIGKNQHVVRYKMVRHDGDPCIDRYRAENEFHPHGGRGEGGGCFRHPLLRHLLHGTLGSVQAGWGRAAQQRRPEKVHIPKHGFDADVGFSVENVLEAFGGAPALLGHLKSERLRGIVNPTQPFSR